VNWLKLFLSLALGVVFATTIFGQAASKLTLNLDGARQVIGAAISKAREVSAPGGTIAVVDDGGHLIALERMDATFTASAHVSIGKARTAAIFKKPTRFFEEVVNKQGRTTMVALDDFTPLQGGVPIVIDGIIVGAIGVSGAASADQDELLAEAGAAAFNPTPSPTATSFTNGTNMPPVEFTHMDHSQVTQAFAKGMPLIETDHYKVHASRRTEPGMAEVHDRETDIVYVLSGNATIVTGGEVLQPQTTAPGEIRGIGISGGQSQKLSAGDVFIVPPGMPHWFKDVDGPFLYFVVKPISGNGIQQ
jgi:glc operon protein GlcG